MFNIVVSFSSAFVS